jgi:hypothetical protein
MKLSILIPLFLINNFVWAGPGDSEISGAYGHTGTSSIVPAPSTQAVSAPGSSDDIARCRQLEGNGAGYTLSSGFVCNGGSSMDESRGKPSSENDACDKAVEKTAKMCKGTTWMQYAPAAAQMISMFSASKSAGNMKAACADAEKINGALAGLNATAGAVCQTAIHSCRKTCLAPPAGSTMSASQYAKDQGKDDAEQCSEFDGYAQQAVAQATASALAFGQSKACADAVDAKCVGDAAANDEDCQQFCMKPGRQDHPKCKIAFNNCADPTYASQNVQMCTCMNNPFAPGCSNLGGPLPTTPLPPAFNPDDGSGGVSDYDFGAGENAVRGASVNAGEGAGSGGGFGNGGGSSPFGADGKPGTGDEGLNKDILTGSGGSSGGAGAIFGGGGYVEGGGGLKGGATKDENGLDLRAFLPGGKKDPNRNPASAGFGDPSITKANGLTNFQKVTRKMNEKRPELMP